MCLFSRIPSHPCYNIILLFFIISSLIHAFFIFFFIFHMVKFLGGHGSSELLLWDALTGKQLVVDTILLWYADEDNRQRRLLLSDAGSNRWGVILVSCQQCAWHGFIYMWMWVCLFYFSVFVLSVLFSLFFFFFFFILDKLYLDFFFIIKSSTPPHRGAASSYKPNRLV